MTTRQRDLLERIGAHGNPVRLPPGRERVVASTLIRRGLLTVLNGGLVLTNAGVIALGMP